MENLEAEHAVELGRIAEDFGGVTEIQRLEPGSSPTSGTCFPCSGACGPLSVHKLFTDGPLWGLGRLPRGPGFNCRFFSPHCNS